MQVIGKCYLRYRDNVTVKKSIASKIKTPFVGRRSHCLNLTVKYVIKVEAEIFQKVNRLMSELRKLTLSANLRDLTPLRSNIPNKIRCISTYNMSLRYFQLREFISKLNSIEIDTFSLIIFENRRVDMLFGQLYDLDSVKKK